MADSLTSKVDDLHLSEGNNTPSTPTDPSPSFDLEATVSDLVARCTTLHEEVETYVAAVDASQKQFRTPNPVEYRSLRNDFKNELAFLKKLVGSDHPEEKIKSYITSSNLVYYESLWSAAKRANGILNFRKYFFWNRQKEGHGPKGKSLAKGSHTKGKSAALVDIVARHGMEWIRVSAISEKRLIFDLAKLGWQQDSDDEDDDMQDAPNENWEDEDDEDQVDIVKTARELARAARANPIRGRPPKVHMVLTRIQSGKTKEVDAILAQIRATGAVVQCVNDIPPPVPLSQVLPNMLIDHSRDLSDTLNVDCTILLALISDISHKECPILEWYPREVQAQIKDEQKEKLLPTHLYPAIAAHPLVCTVEAAEQMNVIVNTLATDTEKTRANILLAQNDFESSSPEHLIKAWVNLSDHPIPEGFKLPIRVVQTNLNNYKLPKVAEIIAQELSLLNTAIFLYGWGEGISTLSSNWARARQIETLINEHGLEDGEAGPHVWLCGESRSLIAKQGRRGR